MELEKKTKHVLKLLLDDSRQLESVCSFLVIDDDDNDDAWQSGEFTNDCVIQQGLVRRARMAS